MRRALVLIALAGCEAPGAPDVLEPRTEDEIVFRNPETCRECHPDHVAAWEGSMHAYAVVDPVFQALNRVKTFDHAGQAPDFCTQCHTRSGYLAGETEVTQDERGVWRQNTDQLSVVAAHGVSCDVCHSITDVVIANNAGFSHQPDGTVRGPIADPVPTDAHPSVESPLHRSGTLCGGCHNVLIPDGGAGVLVERTEVEWRDYIAMGNTQQCQDCHMPAREAPAAVDGPMRTIHEHTFIGVDLALVDFPDRARQRQLVEQMLADAATLDLTLNGTTGFRATIVNRAGHALPSGVTSEREMWLAVRLLDDGGAVVFETGDLDANGDLMKADADLWWFGGELTSNGNPTTFPHLADGIVERTIPPGGTVMRDFTFPTLVQGTTYTLDVTLQFRAFPPYFLRALERHPIGRLDPAIRAAVPILPVARRSTTFTR